MKVRNLLIAVVMVGLLAILPSCGDESADDASGQDAISEDAFDGLASQSLSDETGPPIRGSGDTDLFEDSIEFRAKVFEEGIEYSIELFDSNLGEGLLQEGDTLEIDILGFFKLTVTLDWISEEYREARVYCVLEGLYEEWGYVYPPFGEYVFYWGTNHYQIPPAGADELQAWFWMKTDNIAYHGESVIPGYTFFADGTATEEGEVVEVKLFDDYLLLRLTLWGMGAEEKTLDIELWDIDWNELWWEYSFTIPNSLIVLRMNWDDLY